MSAIPRTHSAGKGDFPRRLTDPKQYARNWDAIDWKAVRAAVRPKRRRAKR